MPLIEGCVVAVRMLDSCQGTNGIKGPSGKMALLADILPGIVIATRLELSALMESRGASWQRWRTSRAQVMNALVLGISSDVEPSHTAWIATCQREHWFSADYPQQLHSDPHDHLTKAPTLRFSITSFWHFTLQSSWLRLSCSLAELVKLWKEYQHDRHSNSVHCENENLELNSNVCFLALCWLWPQHLHSVFNRDLWNLLILKFLVRKWVSPFRFGWRWFFLGPQWAWNGFDVFCLALSWVEEVHLGKNSSPKGLQVQIVLVCFIKLLPSFLI